MNNSYMEDISKLTQKYLEKSPLIIAGSGLSIPYGVSSMRELSDEIILKLNNKYTNNSKWDEFKSELEAGHDLEKTLQKISLDEDLNDSIIRETWSIINERDLALFKKIIIDPEKFILTTLLNKLLEAHPKKNFVITLNYDRLVEYAADLINAKIFDGFTGNIIKYFNPNDYPYKSNEKCIEIWKVHGSLDWFEGENKNIISLPLSNEIPSNFKPLIVTPGIFKFQETHNEPYRTIISKADDIICNSECFLCIGYGFNDEHIQPKLINQIQRNRKPIVVITKELTSNGKSIFLTGKVDKFIIYEESVHNKTRVHSNINGEVEIEGNYWKLKKFIDLWLGE